MNTFRDLKFKIDVIERTKYRVIVERRVYLFSVFFFFLVLHREQ